MLIAYFMILPGGKSHREARGYVITWACLALYQIAKTAVTDQVAGRLRGGRPAKSGAANSRASHCGANARAARHALDGALPC